jgi:preprotein translocase subunit SecA
LKNRARRFLERPGSTVDLRPLEELLPRIETRGEEVAEFSDAELIEAAQKAEEFEEICALGREAAWRGLEQRPYDVQLLRLRPRPAR